MKKPHDRLSAALVKSSLEFHRLALWNEIGIDDVFFIRLPDEPDPLIVTVIGQAGQEFGLSFYRGPGGIDGTRSLVLARSSDDRLLVPAGTSLVSVTFDRLEEIPPDKRRILNDAGFTGRRESIAPAYFTLLAGAEGARLPNRTEMRVLLAALDAVRAARAMGPLETGSAVMDVELPALHVQPSDGGGVSVTWTREPAPPPRELPFTITCDPKAIRATEQLPGRWLADFVHLEQAAGDSSEGETFHAFAVLEEDDGDVVCALRADAGSIHEIAEALLAACLAKLPCGRTGRPAEIVISDAGTARWLAPVLAEYGVAVTHGEESSRFDELFEAAAAAISQTVFESDPDAPPRCAEPVTLENWKAVERELFRKIAAWIRRDPAEMAEAAESFFDDDAALEIVDARPHDAATAFVEWFATEWCESGHDEPLAERWLKRADSDAIRHLLEERIDSDPSFYRVVACHVDRGEIDFVDVWTGEAHTIVDRAMSESATVGAIVPLRILTTPVGKFGTLFGPPLSALEFTAAMSFLEEEFGSISPESLSEYRDQFGLLFTWQKDRARSGPAMPKLQNLDGDPLVPQVATFSVADRAAVIATLESHAEIVPDDEGEGADAARAFVWMKETKKGKRVLGGPTILANIVVENDRLDVHVNSDSRLRKARAWLSKIRGVQFEKSTPVDMEGIRNQPPALRDEPPLDPRAIDVVREHLHRQNLAWLDTKVPMFGGKTPRQLARTPEGRERVAMAIRSMPAARGPGGISIEPPREEMLREIGVEDRKRERKRDSTD